jgi:hypothetical protein
VPQPARIAAALVVSVVAVAVATFGVPPAVANTPTNALTFQGQGGWLSGHESSVYTAAGTFDVVVDPSTTDRLRVSLGTSPAGAELGIVAPTATPRLEVGRYAVGDGRADPTVATLTLRYQQRGCGTATGTVDVLALTRDASGTVTSLALDYDVRRCDQTLSLTRGSQRWQSDRPFQATTATPFSAYETVAGSVARGAVTVTNAGSQVQTYGASTLVFGDESSLVAAAIEDDGCTGRSLLPGASCQVRVSIPSDGVHHFSGYLRTVDQTAWGATFAAVVMYAIPAPLAPEVIATPLRGGVELRTTTWARAYHVMRSTAGGPETVVAHDVTMPWTDTSTVEGQRYTYRVTAVAGGTAGPASTPVTSGPLRVPEGPEGQFVPVDPVRVLDTRFGIGGHHGAVGPGGVITFDPGSGGAVPADGVSAVLLNVTGTEATEVTHVRVWPSGDPVPATSSVNLTAGQSRPNQVVVPVGQDGRVALYNNSGSVHLVVDVQGFYSDSAGESGGGYHPVAPVRVMDTRDPWTGSQPLGPGEEVWVQLNVVDAGPGQVSAVDVNLTATEPTWAGHLVAWPGDLDAPNVSNVNFAPGQTVPNHAVVPVTYDEWGYPGFALRNASTGTTHVIVDLQGWYDDGTRDDGLRFAPTPTSRVADSRRAGVRVAAGDALVVPGSALPTGLSHVVNVTATESTGAGHLVSWKGEGPFPTTSTVNFHYLEDSPNLATVAAAANGQIAITAGTSSVHVVVDDLGYFY